MTENAMQIIASSAEEGPYDYFRMGGQGGCNLSDTKQAVTENSILDKRKSQCKEKVGIFED